MTFASVQIPESCIITLRNILETERESLGARDFDTAEGRRWLREFSEIYVAVNPGDLPGDISAAIVEWGA